MRACGKARRSLGRMLIGVAVAATMPVALAAASPGALARYAGSGHHWVTTGAVGSGYSLESLLGFLVPYPAPGTSAVYGCLSGSRDHFLSLDSGCQGDTVLAREGWIYNAPPSGQASSAVYLCVAATPSSEDHFASNDRGCEGHTVIGTLGYAPASAPLNRYNGGYHWVTTGAVASGYSLEGTLGYLVAGGSGAAPLYGCLAGTQDHFLSLSPGCEGQTILGIEGRIYASPPAGAASVAVYRCATASDHFASLAPNCEGQRTEGLLGYALQSPVPVPPPPPPAPVATTVPQPAPPRGPHHLRALHVRITLSWTWQREHTRLREARIGRLPRGATIRFTCRGRGRFCASRTLSARAGRLRRLVHALVGRVYRAGDRLFITVSARGYAPERAVVRIRTGRLPTVTLL